MVSLGQFFGSRGTDMMTKAIVISEIHAGRLAVVATPAKTVQEIWIPQGALKSLLQTRSLPEWRVLRGSSCNLSNQHGGISMCQAAREIGCDQPTVRLLVKEGMLRRCFGNGCAMWVSTESVDTFRAKYESLRSFARKIRSVPKVLRQVCDELDVPVLDINSKNGACATFIRKGDIQRVLSGRQQVGFVDRHTRIRWKRLAEIKACIGTEESELGMNESRASAC
jgi:hypothetical protein